MLTKFQVITVSHLRAGMVTFGWIFFKIIPPFPCRLILASFFSYFTSSSIFLDSYIVFSWLRRRWFFKSHNVYYKRSKAYKNINYQVQISCFNRFLFFWRWAVAVDWTGWLSTSRLIGLGVFSINSGRRMPKPIFNRDFNSVFRSHLEAIDDRL